MKSGKIQNFIKGFFTKNPLLKSIFALVASLMLVGVVTFAWFTNYSPRLEGDELGVIDSPSGYTIRFKIDGEDADNDVILIKGALPGKRYRISIEVMSSSSGGDVEYRVTMQGAEGKLFVGYDEDYELIYDDSPQANEDVLKFYQIYDPRIEVGGVGEYRSLYEILQGGGLIGVYQPSDDESGKTIVELYIYVSETDPRGLDINRFQSAIASIFNITLSIVIK